MWVCGVYGGFGCFGVFLVATGFTFVSVVGVTATVCCASFLASLLAVLVCLADCGFGAWCCFSLASVVCGGVLESVGGWFGCYVIGFPGYFRFVGIGVIQIL